MRRSSDWFIWIPLIALVAAILLGFLYSFVVGEPPPRIGPLDWFGK